MRRIQRAIDKEEVVRRLTSGEPPIFKEIWRLLMFAASVGFKKGRSEPLGTTDSGKAIPQTYFANSPAWPGFLHLLALVAAGDPHILAGDEKSDDERITLFEEFANGGLAILEEELERRSYSFEAVLEFITQTDTPSLTNQIDTVEI